VVFARLLYGPIDKARPVRTEDPGDAQNQSPIVRLERQAFPFPLGCAVNADGTRLIFFRVRLTLFAIEHIIGTDVNEPRRFSVTDLREHARSLSVERERFLAFRFATIHVRLRRGVDQDIELKLTKPRPHLFRLPEIELRMIESGDLIVAGVFPRQGRAEAAARAHDDYALSCLHSIGFRRNVAASSHRSWSKASLPW